MARVKKVFEYPKIADERACREIWRYLQQGVLITTIERCHYIHRDTIKRIWDVSGEYSKLYEPVIEEGEDEVIETKETKRYSVPQRPTTYKKGWA